MFKVVKHAKNSRGRDFIVGDIHGRISELYKELERIGFDFSIDRLFSVGDIIDRGPSSLELVILAADEDWFIPIMGNHEFMAIYNYHHNQFADTLKAHGGEWFLSKSKKQKKEISSILEQFPLAIELEASDMKIGIVHAEVPFADWNRFAPLNNDVLEYALWSVDKIKSRNPMKVSNIDYVFVGHYGVPEISILGNTLYIDTHYVSKDKRFSIIEIEKFFNSY